MSSRRRLSTRDVLPENLIIHVLSRLPVKKIICFKFVCKTWSGLVSDPYFVHLHLSRSRESETLLIHERTSSDISRRKPGSLKWVDIIQHEDDDYRLGFVKSFNLNHYAPRVELFGKLQVGSVNGLVCYVHPFGAMYILNPVLGEYMILPVSRLENHVVLSYGFGVSMVGEYKVIRICPREISEKPNQVYEIEIEVYILGTNQWRSLGQIPYNLCNIEGEVDSGVFVNGHVYWIINGRIYDFDLKTETFKLFASPQRLGNNQEPYKVLGVLKGRLSWISFCGLGLEVWVMKGKSWCKEIAIRGTTNPSLRLLAETCKPSCVIGGLKGTSILIFYDFRKKKVVAYCLDTNTILNLNVHGGYFEMIKSYRPSLVKPCNVGPKRVRGVYNKHGKTIDIVDFSYDHPAYVSTNASR